MVHLKSSLECIQIAWACCLRDFRQWCKPEGQAVYAWKNAPLKQAIGACRSDMMDDAESMLNAWAKNDNGEYGQSAFIPTMITAVAPIQSPPEYEQVVGRSEWLNVVLPHDPKKRVVSLRTMPSAFRCQIAFFCPDSHGAMMVANQFCLYFKNEAKRTFSVGFEFGFVDDHQQQKLVDDWQFRVLENSLFPDKVASDYKNLTIVTVDCTIIGDIPIVSGLGGEWDGVTDTKEVGTPPLHKPIVGTRTPAYIAKQNSVVTEADVYDDVAENHVRLTADPKTLQVRQTKLNKP